MIEIEQHDFPLENETESNNSMWSLFFLIGAVALLLIAQTNFYNNSKN